ncbi:MAG: ATP-dependent sacrificial sulfur transferase LarE, partial [Myxococcales bacterium]|nr:ATP-dependent sacrificial sulfur transferase LarE [Myxococcales bacterium]
LPQSERDEAVKVARQFGARHELIASDEIHNPAYAANPTNRCFFCKQALFHIAEELKTRTGIPHMAIGTNTDDLGDHRPGLDAAKRYGALSPLVEAGFSKNDVRTAAKSLGIEIWDKPAYACLSSRFPYGTKITEERLDRVGQCEALLKKLGFKVFRVRFHDDLARIEVSEHEITRLAETHTRNAITEGFRAAGFKFVTIDLEAYRSGRLNEDLPDRS